MVDISEIDPQKEADLSREERRAVQLIQNITPEMNRMMQRIPGAQNIFANLRGSQIRFGAMYSGIEYSDIYRPQDKEEEVGRREEYTSQLLDSKTEDIWNGTPYIKDQRSNLSIVGQNQSLTS